MISPAPGTTATTPADPAAADTAPPEVPLPPTPWKWRFIILGGLCAVGVLAYAGSTALASQPQVAYRVQAGCGIVFFLGLAALFSKSLQSVSRKTLLWGMGLQFMLAVFVLYSPQVRTVFEWVGAGIKALITASDKGAEFVFGNLARPDHMAKVFGDDYKFCFAFRALPPIIFVSSFFSVLYYLGILQFFVKLMELLGGEP